MPSYQLLRCMVALGGDQGNQVYRDRSRPIVFPELPLLQFLHGDEAVSEVHVVGTWHATNDEVLIRLQTLYAAEAVQAVFPGARPRLPTGDNSIPRCTLPVYKPRPPEPDNPDPKLRPLDQFTITEDMPVMEAPPLPAEEDLPPLTPDELAAHLEDAPDDDQPETEDDMGLVPPVVPVAVPSAADQPHIVRDTHGRGSSRRASAARTPSHLPDVNAGGSHGPGFEDYTSRVLPRG